MTIIYKEAFNIAGYRMGIEECENEFKLWLGGSAIGHSDSIEGARELLAMHMRSKLRMTLAGHKDKVDPLKGELRSLNLHPAGILHFLTSYETSETDDGTS